MQIMSFAEAETYRFNPFDLTKVWPHSDYPRHEVSQLTLNRNPSDFHIEIEQAAFEVPVHSCSKDSLMRVRNVSDPCPPRIPRAALRLTVNAIPR
jgi:catalase